MSAYPMTSTRALNPPLDTNLWSQNHLAHVEQALTLWVGDGAPAGLGDAMRYAVLDGGKRLRPLLVLAAYEAARSGSSDSAAPEGAALDEAALRAACAVELIHAYSLVHDDMPCMDNDVLRRGKPTVHVQFGEAQALLAGDALQAFAFELLTPDNTLIPAATQAALCRLLARAAGSAGMAGGPAGCPARRGGGVAAAPPPPPPPPTTHPPPRRSPPRPSAPHQKTPPRVAPACPPQVH